jgi:hypothetical protein
MFSDVPFDCFGSKVGNDTTAESAKTHTFLTTAKTTVFAPPTAENDMK